MSQADMTKEELSKLVDRMTGIAEGYYDQAQKREQQIQTVRGAIIGALAGGHIDGHDGAAYSKNVLLQIASILGIELPESVR